MKKLKIVLCGMTLALIISIGAQDAVVFKKDPGGLGANTSTERVISPFKKDPGGLG